MTDTPDLTRFLEAQASIYAAALAELKAGRKRTHWMWFVFPQLQGLGHSQTARYYAITSLAEARAYAEHVVLGARLRESTEAVLALESKTAHEIFGSPDDLKFRSSMTLFSLTSAEPSLFQNALSKYFEAGPDPRTIELVRSL
ncbi:MAG TPA: DUF1810 domain-containing protein [Polyangiaceae bacterium]|jgi:uncharacterized protein (DUF1810 family)|nr:DUF1810 domain-containing protein [Polyangiaceae bacterium]